MQYVSLLKDPPTAAQVHEIEQVEYDGERLVVRGEAPTC